MKKILGSQQGQSLLEVIVAIAIFSLFGAALTTMIIGSFSSLTRGGDYAQAESLAQEGIEAVRSIRDRAWNKLNYSQSGVGTSSNVWDFLGEGTTETIGKFTRTISFADVCRDNSYNLVDCPGSFTDVHTKKVTVRVTWNVRPGVIGEVEEFTYLSNWESTKWTQTDWSGGGGQSIWFDSSQYDSDDDNLYTGESGQVALGQTLAAEGENNWPFNNPGNYTFNSNKIEVTSGVARLKSLSEESSGITKNEDFENTTDTSFDWTFTTSSDYVYDSGKIEVTGGEAGLVEDAGACLGTSTSCTNISSSTICSNQAGCSWDPGNCFGTSYLTCSELADQGVTCSDCGCSYTPGGCSNSGSCGDCGDSASCGDCATAGCSWDSFSCPLVESWNGDSWIKEHEAFPFSVFESVRNTTFDSLPSLKCEEGMAKIRIHETLPENTYLEEFKVFIAKDPQGFLKPDIEGRPRVIQEWISPQNCLVSEVKSQEECMSLIESHDEVFYEPQFDPEKREDWIEMEFENVNSQDPKLYFVARKQHFYTTYFDYMVHIMGEERYPGFSRISDWPLIDKITNSWWEKNLKMKIETWDGQKWVKQGAISAGRHMPGSGADDFLVSLEDINSDLGKIKIRFRFLTGSFGIDYVALDDSPDPDLEIKEVNPEKIFLNGKEISNFQQQLGFEDIIESRYKCEKGDSLFFSISGYYHPKEFVKEREKDFISAWSEYFMFFLGGKDYVVETAARKGLFKEARSLSVFSAKELREQARICSVAYLVFAEIVLLLISLILFLVNIRKKIVVWIVVLGSILLVLLIFHLSLVSAAGTCGGTLDCSPLGEVDCNTCSQCSWANTACTGSIADCSTFGTQALCEDDCGCNWDEADCYNDPGATACSSLSDETNCQNQDGCVWQKYSTDRPDIYPAGSYEAPGVLSWDGFTETATKNGGEIYYQLSDDNGSTWYYWNGSVWSEVSAPTDYNTAPVVDANISEFSTSSEQIKFKAFLESDGNQLIRLDNISLDFTPSPQVWSFSAWDVGGGEVTPTGNRQYSGGNPDNYVDITVPASRNDEVGGYWEQAFEVTAVNPSVNINFDYKVFDFNEIPSVGEIRVYLDSSSGDPITQVGSGIPLSGEGSWTSVSSLDASSAITATGTYYLKIAFWVESSFWQEGPFTIGFDNTFLSWNAGSYASDQPTIRNSGSFEPTVISGWTSFVETASKYSGEIYYQLSDDDGSTWQYWDGASWANDPDGDEGSSENDYNTAYTVNNYINLFDASNKKIMYKAFLAGNGSSTIELDNIKIGYNITDSLYLGNKFTVSEVFGANALWQSGYRASMRFRAQESKTVSSLRIYLDSENGNSPVYRYGLQSDSGGSPSGTWLGSTNQGYGDLQATSPGWKTIALNENVSLTQGITYHLVTQYQSGTINFFRSVELRASNPNNFLNPLNNSSDSSSNYLWSNDSGSSWTPLGYQPIYVLGFTDGSFGGNPYENLSEISVYGNNYAGQEFSFASEKKMSSLGFLVSDNNSNPVDSLYVALYDVSSSTQLASGELAKATGTTATYEWKDYIFSSPIVLDANKIYRAYIYSPSSLSTDYYRVRAIYHNNNSALNSINYLATSSHYINSSDGGSNWNTTNPNYDIGGFRMASTLYKTSGYLISSAFDAGAPANFNVLDWSGQTPICSPSCEIKAQIQTAPDNSGSPGAWSATWCGPEGEDGDESDYFILGAGELIHTDHNDDQWIRYKVFLSGDSAETPILEDINIFYK